MEYSRNKDIISSTSTSTSTTKEMLAQRSHLSSTHSVVETMSQPMNSDASMASHYPASGKSNLYDHMRQGYTGGHDSVVEASHLESMNAQHSHHAASGKSNLYDHTRQGYTGGHNSVVGAPHLESINAQHSHYPASDNSNLYDHTRQGYTSGHNSVVEEQYPDHQVPKNRDDLHCQIESSHLNRHISPARNDSLSANVCRFGDFEEIDKSIDTKQEQKEKQETKPAVPQNLRYMRVKQNRQLKSCSERNSKSINSSLSDKRNIDVVFLIGYNWNCHNQWYYVEQEVLRTFDFVKSFFSAFDIDFCIFVHNSRDYVASSFTKEQSQLEDTLRKDMIGGIINERVLLSAVESITSLPFRSKSLRILIDFACSDIIQYKLSSRYAKILQQIDVNHIIAAFPGVPISHLGRQDPVNRFSLVDAMFESISFQFELEHPPSLPMNILERFYMLYNPTRSEKPLEECQRIPFRIEAKLQRCEPVPSNYDTNLIPQLQEDCGEVFFDREVRDERDFTIYLATFSIGRETKHLDVIIPKTGLIDETKQDSPGLIQWMEEDMFLRQLGCTFANSFNEKTSGLRLRVLPSFILRANIGGKRVAILCQEHTSEESSCFTQNAFTMKKGDICSRLVALSHFSYLVSRSSLLLTNFYGYHSGDEIVLTKLNLASNDVTRFGPYNPGMDGMRLFINNHKCNKYCKEVGLRRQEVDNFEEFSSEFKYFVNRPRERMDVEDSKRKEAAVNQVDERSRFSTNEENTEYIPCPTCGGCGQIPVDRTSGQRIDDGLGSYSQMAQSRRNMYDSDAQAFNHAPYHQTTRAYPQQSTPHNPTSIPSSNIYTQESQGYYWSSAPNFGTTQDSYGHQRDTVTRQANSESNTIWNYFFG